MSLLVYASACGSRSQSLEAEEVSQSLDSEWVSLRQGVSESPESEEYSARSEL
jgi:hypothetical protein